MSTTRMSVKKYVSLEVDIEAEDVLRSISNELLRAECFRRGIPLADEQLVPAPISSRSGKYYKIPICNLEEVRSQLGRGNLREALIVLERALPGDLDGAFTSPVRWS